MNAPWLLQNVWAWSVQVAVLTGAAWLATRRWQEARTRLWFWQAVLAATFLLPFASPWRTPPAEWIPRPAGTPPSVEIQYRALEGSQTATQDWILTILLAGCAVRLLMMAAGLFRLALLRRRARPIEGPEGANWFSSAAVRGPVTFGSTVLLDQRALTLPGPELEAIQLHELIHVERKDWLFVLWEESVRALAWFHPGVWLALSQIHLAREQSVDSEVVRRTGNREAYMEALLAIASQNLHRSLEPDLAPAPLFLKKRHLARRVAAVVQEDSMSKLQVAVRVLAGATAAIVAGVAAISLFPLSSQAQAQPDSAGITVETRGLLHRGPVVVPSGLRTGGVVMIEATLNREGEVADARVVSGPEELRNQALKSVLGWHYEANTPSPVQIAVRYEAAAPTAVFRGGITNKRGLPIPSANWRGTVREIVVKTLSPELQTRVLARIPLHPGDVISMERAMEAMAAIEGVGGHLLTTLEIPPDNSTVSFVVRLPQVPAMPTPPPAANSGPPAPLNSPPPPPPPAANRTMPSILVKTTPWYPPAAKEARVQGAVILSVEIGADGAVASSDAIRGDPLLIDAAKEAVSKWQFRPATEDGKPVPYKATVEINFSLSQDKQQ